MKVPSRVRFARDGAILNGIRCASPGEPSCLSAYIMLEVDLPLARARPTAIGIGAR